MPRQANQMPIVALAAAHLDGVADRRDDAAGLVEQVEAGRIDPARVAERPGDLVDAAAGIAHGDPRCPADDQPALEQGVHARFEAVGRWRGLRPQDDRDRPASARSGPRRTPRARWPGCR